MSRLKIQAFGGLQVFGPAQTPLAVPAKKVRALLAYLALNAGRPQPRVKLAGLLWSDSNEAQARASLRQAVLVLRKALALGDADLVAGAGETIELSAAAAELDVRTFERLLEDGSTAALEQATELYTGELLEAVETCEAAFDDWLVERRNHLRERATAAMSQLLAHYTHSGELERAVGVALRTLALDPLQENVHRALMQLYARQGRPTSALRQFQMCREVLARELGMQPHAQTVQLRDAIEREGRVPAAGVREDADASMELRPVAVVVAESTWPGEEGDPEHAQAHHENFAAAATEIAARFGGTLARRFGRGITALFGIPAAHSNDLERAARCALALCQRLDGARIGLAAGSVLVTRRSDGSAAAATSGEPLGLAARLAAAAGPGEVIAADAAWRALTPRAVGQRRPEASLPVSLRKLACWRLEEMRTARLPRTSLVGRRTELNQFAASLQACRAQGTGLTVHVRGEAGIGKSRLVEEFRAIAAAQGFACHGGVVLDFGSGVERDALRTVVEGLLDIEADRAGAAEDALARARASGLVEATHEVHLRDLLHAPLPAPLRAVFDAMDHATRAREQNAALANLLRRVSADTPRMVVLDDLHWASPRMLSRAAALAAGAEQCAAVLVTTARSDGDPLDAAWRSAAAVSAMVTFDLGPLRWAEASALAAQFADAADAFVIRCIERAGGNPLFLEQLLSAGRDASDALPTSVQSVVQTRLDTLGAAERHAVRVASILGQRFSLPALAHLLGGAAWDPHLAQDLLRIEGNAGVFAHALVHEGAYVSLPRDLRRELHASAAGWFSGRDPILRAEHLDRAEDPDAAQAYLEAALAQAAVHRHEQAAQLAGRGLALADTTGPRFALSCARADALHDLGANAEAQRAYEAALDAAADDVERCRAWLGLAGVLRVRDELARAQAALAAAETAATAHGLTEQRARIHLQRGNLLFPLGDLTGCERENECALAFARQARSIEPEASALGGLGDAAFLRGHMLTARKRFVACVALARQHGLKRVEATYLPMAAISRWYEGDTRAALVEALAAVGAAAQIGHRRAEVIAHHGAYQDHHALRRFDAALAHLDRALLLARQIQAPRFEAQALAFRGDLLRAQGERAAALVELRQALAIARATGMAYMGPLILGMLARASDDAVERNAALNEAETLLATNGLAHNHLLFRRDAIDGALEACAWDDALRHAAALEARTQSEPLPWSEFFVARGRALARHGADRSDIGERDELRRLRIDGERLGLLEALVTIDAALH
ncbi:MAG TPA: BTAD domain-containing putative transcriptional regulator [Burkholderiaceae bacterium]|nr:BTAD domain-containing putative transcriptional regulator [Burkholderiaceae bacterium]